LVRFEIPVARLFTGTWLNLPVIVLHGKAPGPKVWLDAAIHGDELNGIEAIRLALKEISPKNLRGSVIAVPMVNVFGLIHQSRYLPDRRDLNRSFPGSRRGSLAARLANLFLTEIVSHCDYGIDFHTGSLHRTNLPQIRADLKNEETHRIAEAFGAPLVLNAKAPKGTLRGVTQQRGIPMIVYEAGEPLRFDPQSIEVGSRGILRVLAELGMIDRDNEELPPSFEGSASRWVRASKSGIFRLEVELGAMVSKRQSLGFIYDPLDRRRRRVRAPFDGIVVGFTNNPLVHQGDALLHLAREEI